MEDEENPEIIKLNKWKESWLKMAVAKQFETAVNIIRNLPKDGKFLLMLRASLSALKRGMLLLLLGISMHNICQKEGKSRIRSMNEGRWTGGQACRRACAYEGRRAGGLEDDKNGQD